MIPELIKEMLIPPPNKKGKERHNEVRGREAGKPGRWGQCHPVPVVVTERPGTTSIMMSQFRGMEGEMVWVQC